LAACGADTEANIVAQVGWRFNYRDWSKPACAESDSTTCTDDDLRGCANTGPLPDVRLVYDAIAEVRLRLENPALPTYDEKHPCGRGENDGWISIKGIGRDVYTLTLSALAGDGTELYRHVREGFDLTTKPQERFELASVVGDILVDVAFPGDPLQCPQDAARLAYAATPAEADAALVEGTLACDDSAMNGFLIRNIPAQPEKTNAGGYEVLSYGIQIAGLSASGDVTYCGSGLRGVNPGHTVLTVASPVSLSAADTCF
jgi:hypothetical protein